MLSKLPKNKKYKKPKLSYFKIKKNKNEKENIINENIEEKSYLSFKKSIIENNKYKNFLQCNITEHNITEIKNNEIFISSFYFNSNDDNVLMLYPFYNKKIDMDIKNQIVEIKIFEDDKEYISHGYFYKNIKNLYIVDLLINPKEYNEEELITIKNIENKKNFIHLNKLQKCILECRIKL